MEKTHSCGHGLAAHSAMPALLSELMDAVGENLEFHMKSLGDDANARREHEAYASLVKQHREVAAALRAIGSEMASYRDLPMGAHDITVLSAPPATAAFEKYVAVKRRLATLLTVSRDADDQMLTMMRGAK